MQLNIPDPQDCQPHPRCANERGEKEFSFQELREAQKNHTLPSLSLGNSLAEHEVVEFLSSQFLKGTFPPSR